MATLHPLAFLVKMLYLHATLAFLDNIGVGKSCELKLTTVWLVDQTSWMVYIADMFSLLVALQYSELWTWRFHVMSSYMPPTKLCCYCRSKPTPSCARLLPSTILVSSPEAMPPTWGMLSISHIAWGTSVLLNAHTKKKKGLQTLHAPYACANFQK